MSKPVFLIFGADGWIGKKMCKLLQEKEFKFYKSNCRADDSLKVENELLIKDDITHVMSFIGRTHGTYDGEKIGTIDYLEKPGKLVDNLRDNLYSPLVLAEICKTHNKHFTYLGTGCIFDYDENHPYGDENNGFTERSLPNFFGSSYSIVKGYTDRIMKTIYNKTALNVRIRMPITDEFNDRNFITKITNYQKVCSIPNSMTVLPELLPIMLDLSIKGSVGTINLTNPGVITHNEILELYKEIVDPDFVWENFSIEEQNEILASKRSNNCLSTTNLQDLTDNKVKYIKESVKDILYKMKINKNNNNLKV